MTDASTDLATWLLEQLAEDERKARAWRARDDESLIDTAGLVMPGWMLAEVDAKRRIIELHKQNELRDGEPEAQWGCQVCDAGFVSCGCVGWQDWPCDTLKLLALPYADYPGYREEWRP